MVENFQKDAAYLIMKYRLSINRRQSHKPPFRMNLNQKLDVNSVI